MSRFVLVSLGMLLICRVVLTWASVPLISEQPALRFASQKPILEIAITHFTAGLFPSGGCDPSFTPDITHMADVRWQVMGEVTPVEVWLSYTIALGPSQKLGPFLWPEADNFVLVLSAPEGGLSELEARLWDAKGSFSCDRKRLLLEPCRTYPPAKPMISVLYDEFPTDGRIVAVPKTLINNIDRTDIQSMSATGVRSTDLSPPLVLEGGEKMFGFHKLLSKGLRSLLPNPWGWPSQLKEAPSPSPCRARTSQA